MDRIYLGEKLEEFLSEKAEEWLYSPNAENNVYLRDYLFDSVTDSEENEGDTLWILISDWSMDYCLENGITGECTEEQEEEIYIGRGERFAKKHKIALFFFPDRQNFSTFPIDGANMEFYRIPDDYTVKTTDFGIYIVGDMCIGSSYSIGAKDGVPVILPGAIPLTKWTENKKEYSAYLDRIMGD